ncbi:potassium channel family protein [Marinobacter sp. 71-i]|uniref:Potassium channel family protein n=1 Tax=Marinobacter iranensis TaxID=2962607 RepID=A0ABT5YEB7_9GAMM|nr:potassium channel family protein [Marinobacter iranensis]MDF0752008.1 potassium channel family protein [Marinobacter iranensis]
MRLNHHSPTQVGILYAFLVLAFTLLYWFCPSFWKSPLTFIDSFYFSVVTITTLGYGDITPQTNAARLATSAESLSGIFVIGLFLNAITYNFSARELETKRKEEDEKWRPARLLMARHICKMHASIFWALQWIINPANKIDKKQHGIPPEMSQRNADGWGRRHQINPLEPQYDELKKMVEYNNVALDSTLHPKVVSFITCAKQLIKECDFIVQAYEKKEEALFVGSFDSSSALEMEKVYKFMISVFPEVVELENLNRPMKSADELIELASELNDKVDFLRLNVR